MRIHTEKKKERLGKSRNKKRECQAGSRPNAHITASGDYRFQYTHDWNAAEQQWPATPCALLTSQWHGNPVMMGTEFKARRTKSSNGGFREGDIKTFLKFNTHSCSSGGPLSNYLCLPSRLITVPIWNRLPSSVISSASLSSFRSAVRCYFVSDMFSCSLS